MTDKTTNQSSSDESVLEPANEKQLDNASGGFIWGALAGAGFVANVWSDGRNASATTAKNSSILEQADAIREEAQQRKETHKSKHDMKDSAKKLDSLREGIDMRKLADYVIQKQKGSEQ